ncbi:glycosyltransferase family 4 protein [Photobacterium satsumensis]|uniref:glycosyltransferase family 4 protein n=1 Tax=Photobacterium satsumensis TaxID=2910239 RepID=UPI003D0E456F
MIIYDPIIHNLQSHGGITVYFNNLLSGCKVNNVEHLILTERLKKYQRYFDLPLSSQLNSHKNVFHSSYYRLPSQQDINVVTTVHDFTYEKFVTGIPLAVHSWQKNRAVRNSDINICVSHNTAKDLQEFVGISEDRIRVVHNGVSENYFLLESESRMATSKVVFIGARKGYKNFEMAVKALSSFSDLELAIVGGGELDEGELKLLHSYLPNRFEWLGKLDDSELNILYNNAFCLFYPSSYEGFGIPVIEAMRAGCPVVAVDSSSIPEVGGNAALLARSADVDEFRTLIDRLFVAQERTRLQALGLEQSAKFSWDRCFQETLAVYAELI